MRKTKTQERKEERKKERKKEKKHPQNKCTTLQLRQAYEPNTQRKAEWKHAPVMYSLHQPFDVNS
jgi:hypothetical protein